MRYSIMAIIPTRVDVVPQIDVTGDFALWKDNSILSINSKVNALLTMMEMEKGTLPDYPECGAREILNKIYYSTQEKAAGYVDEIKAMAKVYIQLTINFVSRVDPSDDTKLNITIEIDGLPVTLSFSLVNNSATNIVNIVNPSIV